MLTEDVLLSGDVADERCLALRERKKSLVVYGVRKVKRAIEIVHRKCLLRVTRSKLDIRLLGRMNQHPKTY